jgi:hypothetical protein
MKDEILKDFETYTKEQLEVAKHKLNSISAQVLFQTTQPNCLYLVKH